MLKNPLDIESTYPTEQDVLNISKETTIFELAQIEGIDDRKRRALGINLSGGHVNAVEICCSVYAAPTFDTLLNAFNRELGASNAPIDQTNTFNQLPSQPVTVLAADTVEQLSSWNDYYMDDDVVLETSSEDEDFS